MTLEKFLEGFGLTKESAKQKIIEGMKFGKVVVHDGPVFHADEVFALALLEVYRKILNNSGLENISPITFTRARNLETEPQVLHIDVDLSFLDHHFPNEQKAYHEDGTIPYASCGLIWAIIGDEIVDEKYVSYVAKTIFDPIDAADNGVEGTQCQFSTLVSGFNYCWNENPVHIKGRMNRAMDIAVDIIYNEVKEMWSKSEANDLVKKYLENSDGTIVKLDQFCPWQEVLIPSDAKFVYWQRDGKWCCQAVPIEPMSFGLKTPFKESWRGLRNSELQQISGLNLEFVHASGFYMVAETEEDVIEACRQSLEA